MSKTVLSSILSLTLLSIFVSLATFVIAKSVRMSIGEQEAMVASVTEADQHLATINELEQELQAVKREDQYQKNEELQKKVEQIEKLYGLGATLFERRAELSATRQTTRQIDLELASYLAALSARDEEGAINSSQKIAKLIDEQEVKRTPVAQVTESASNSLPGSGYSRQKVATARGEFVVASITAPGARVVVETASDSDCADNCPVKSLAEHIATSGGFAGINGAYFCPPDYARCQGKVNSFDTLAMNGRSKAVLNAANNVYSTVPLVAAYGTSLSFYDQTLQWGADSSSNGAIANYPRLLRDSNVATHEENGKGVRGFVGVKDGAIVIGHVYAASFADTAEVLKTLGLQNAMNLDGGGSSALYYEGSYKVGPGRALPTALVLVR